MDQEFIAQATHTIQADAQTVWNTITDPAKIAQYLFGTAVETDWKEGSPIFFRGEWNGTKYEDKGVIIDCTKNVRLRHTYWSSMSGTQDAPENYSTVTYQLDESNGTTTLTVIQGGMKTEHQRDHSAQNWKMVLEGIAKIIEA